MGLLKEHTIDLPNEPFSVRYLYSVCGLLFAASAINYMDRQTLSSIAPRITREFALGEIDYGWIEGAFGWGFAAGSLFFGFLADRFPVRIVYPIAVLLWSITGFMTSFASSFHELILARGILGFVEAAHWPCGLKVTQALLSRNSRSLGNSILQSGTTIGACITPLLMYVIITTTNGAWRIGFQVIGSIGLLWIVAWLYVVRKNSLPFSDSKSSSDHPRNDLSWLRDIASYRFLVVLWMLLCINTTWQILRAWLPKILQQDLKYSEQGTLFYTSIWYIATDIGCILSGAIAYYLSTHRNMPASSGRITSVAICALSCSTIAIVPWMQSPYPILIVFAIAGAGCLGLFPMYYAFSQDVSRNHQGKVTALTGLCAWIFSAMSQVVFGAIAEWTHSFKTGLVLLSVFPMLALLALFIAWRFNKLEAKEFYEPILS